ncbi:MAG: hypothetical protein AAFU85_33680 [Planctomycetota bacterium]
MRFRLSTILLLVSSVALSLGNLVAWRDATDARIQLRRIEADFGLITGEEESQTHIRQFAHRDYSVPNDRGPREAKSFRVQAGRDARYTMHLSDITNATFAVPDMNGLAVTLSAPLVFRPTSTGENELVLSCQVNRERGLPPRIAVSMNNATAFSFVSSDDWSKITSRAQSTIGFDDTERLFRPDESIPLFYWFSPPGKRGFLVWLEPSTEPTSKTSVPSRTDERGQ